MFNKLVSSLPFNPSLINQVSLYAQRLRKEASIRRLGFIFVALVIFVQLFAVLSPAQPSLAIDQNNDLILGGVKTKQQIVDYCNNNSDYRTILAHFAISCSNLQNNSAVTSLRADATRNGQPLYSMGHESIGQVYEKTGKVTNEVQVPITGLSRAVYMRLLSSFDGNWVSTYQALSVGNFFGVQFFILFSCGNLVEFGKPYIPPPTPPPTPKPTPKPVPTPTPTAPILGKRARNITRNIPNADNTTAQAGDVIEYTLLAKNTGKVTDKNFVVQENISDVLEYADIGTLNGGAIGPKGNIKWAPVNIAPNQTIQKVFTVKVKNPIPQTPSPCPPSSTVSHCPLSSSFDLIMTNTYGNTINIRLPHAIIKTTEIVTTTELVNTGPGTSLIIGFAGATIVGYFYARSRLMAKELAIIRKDYTSSGGM